ncbi:MAG: BamA/TamA family outer membrane protein [Chitinispirillaceae bacterium]|nr:BamA/TamA family outer membrane protein [Chitinispirillaceae bacterium]
MKKTYNAFIFCLVLVSGISAVPRGKKVVKPRPWRVKSISIEGNRTFKKFELLSQLDLRPVLFKKSPRYSKGRMKSDILSLTRFYKTQGFITTAVEGRVIHRDTLKKKVTIAFTIHEGPRTIVSSIEYLPYIPDSIRLRSLKCHPGKPLIFSDISSDGETLRKSRAEKGYINATSNFSISIDTAASTATVSFMTTDRQKVIVDTIKITGQEKLREKVISRELQFRKNDTLSLDAIRKSEQRLYRTGLFSSVYVEPFCDSSSGESMNDTASTVHQPVVVSLRESDFFRLKLGIGYGNEDKIRGSIETSYLNFFRSGHRGTLKGNLSQKIQQIQTVYSTPWLWGLPLDFNATLYYNHFSDTTTFRGAFWGTLFSFEKSISDVLKAQLWTKFEDVVWINTESLPGEFPRQNTQSFGIDLTFDTRNDLLNPSTGAYSLLKGEVAGLAGINSNQFLKFTVDNRLYWKTGPFSCGSGVKIGWVNPYGKSSAVPIQDQFFAGGSRSVRGYRENFLSTFTEIPDSGAAILRAKSGRVMLTANLLEIRFPIIWWINGAVFTDAGVLRDNLNDISVRPFLKEILWTAGPGLRVNTPLAIIRFDFGFKLNPRSGEPLTQWHLDVGQSF